MLFLAVTAQALASPPFSEPTPLPLKSQPVSRPDPEGAKSVAQPAGFISCTACGVLVATLQDLVRKNSSEEEIVPVSRAICIDFKIQDERVCTGVTKEYKDMVVGVTDLCCGSRPDRGLWIPAGQLLCACSQSV